MSPRFWEEVVGPLSEGRLPEWQPEWVEHARDWQPNELSYLTALFTEWHNGACGCDPNMESWIRFDKYRKGSLPNSLLGAEFFPGLPQGFFLELALAFAPVGSKIGGPSGSVPMSENLFTSRWFGGDSKLFGNYKVNGNSGLLNPEGGLLGGFKAGWSKSKGQYVFRFGFGHDAVRASAAGAHKYLNWTRIDFVRSDVLIDVMRGVYN